ncbi:MAG: hypothetical protein RBU45_07645 [Myxococcota bacterium]|jgi:hypothetical protein|nr:hypothetical protein [Myxococcota bacterium]
MADPDHETATPPRPAEEEPSFQTRIFIDRDGQVVFENLAEELLPLVAALDPDAELSCRLPADDPPPEPAR